MLLDMDRGVYDHLSRQAQRAWDVFIRAHGFVPEEVFRLQIIETLNGPMLHVGEYLLTEEGNRFIDFATGDPASKWSVVPIRGEVGIPPGAR